MNNFNIGDRIRVRVPKNGRDFHLYGGEPYFRECFPGARGKIRSAPKGRYRSYSVQWDQDQKIPASYSLSYTSQIDESCLEAELDESELEEALASIASAVSPSKPQPHCPTCKCFP